MMMRNEEIIHMFMAVRFDTTGSLARNLDTKLFLKRQSQAKRHIFYIKETSLLVASGEEVEHSGDPQHHPGNLYLILQIFLFSVKLSPRTSYTDQIHQKSRFLPRGSCIILNPECEEGGHD